MLDSDILEVLITVRQNREGADRNFNHPEMMERPILATNSEDGFDFDAQEDGLWFEDNAFESYHG